MKYLILSIVGCGFYMVPRLAKATDTEKVYFWCRDNAKMEKLGKGMENLPGWEKFEKVKDFGKVLKRESKDNLIIIMDDTGMGFTADVLRSEGWKVVSGGELAEKMEGDRWWSIQMMKKVMKVPETVYYDTFEEGFSFLKSREKSERWCFKPQDPEVPKDKTYVGKNIQDVIEAMQNFKSSWEWGDGFVLQSFVDGYEGDMSAYFVNGEYLPNSLNWYFENKAFETGDKGPATGGEIAVSFFRPMDGKAKEIFDKLKPLLTKYNYNGQLAINCMFSKEDHEPYFLELTPRFGYPSLEIEITLEEDSGHTFAELIKMLAGVTKSQSMFPTNKIGTIVTVSTPPYPIDQAAEMLVGKMPISWDKKWDNYMFPWFMMYDEKKRGHALCGYSGHALSVTCAAENLDGAVQMTYETYIPTIKLQNIQYRIDLGKNAKERIKILKDWKVIL